VQRLHGSPGQRGVLRECDLHQVGLALAQRQQPHQVADGHGLLHESGEEAGGGHGDVDAPVVAEQPLVARVVDPGHDAADGELGLGEQRHDEVDLVVAGGGDDDVAALQAGLLQGGELTGVGVDPLGAFHRLGLDVGELPLDEHDLVLALHQLQRDGAADGPGSCDRDAHLTQPSWGGVPAAAVTSLTVPDTAAT
jgi:hypothetical protein